ncbi:uncharacterized protein LOC120986624 isoform X3 [Bufo bufo]|uniref:uncharacterized protein LOC120986624 isoform X3 n=2 Tax=Bufo bufo TaxID=8384 RepID=UPI001ABDD3D3|nr:uncharacterized protein LOC120986624 isoform X3 [Bufo bufo]
MDPHAAGHPWNNGPVQTQPQWQSMPPPYHQNQLYNPRAMVPLGLELLVEEEEVILQKQGHPWNSGPVQTQPQWQSMPPPYHQNQLYNPRAMVPPGLELLVEVEEVILQKQAFFNRSGQNLFTIHRESECCGPGFNVRFRNPYQKDVVSLYAESGGCCWGGYSHVRISVFPACTIGFINIKNFTRKMSVSIRMNSGELVFTAELPLSGSEKIIEILSVNGSCPVATITTQGQNCDVVFQFPMDMEATLKTLILAAFVYMRYQLSKMSSSSSSSAYHRRRNTANHDDDHRWGHGGFNGHPVGGGFSGGDCGGGGGNSGGGGGDCGGGGGNSGGGGGDCGGGGGNSGGGGGDCGGGGGGCGGGGGDCGGGGGGCG